MLARMANKPTFTSLAEAAQAVKALLAAPPPRPAGGRWSAAQMLDHCAMSIDCSMNGFPVAKPALVRATIGRIALRRILGKGDLSHDRHKQIPGVAEPAADASIEGAAARLLGSIDTFQAYDGPMASHFMFGPVNKDEYARFHALHIADHLAGLTPP